MGYSLQTSASSSASTAGKSGDISGGTAFNIGGINLGTQYPTAATAGGGAAAPGTLGNLASNLTPILVIGGATAAILLLVLLWKKRK